MAALRLHRNSDLQQLLNACQKLLKNDIFSEQPLLVCTNTTQALWYKRLLAQYCNCSFALEDIRPSQLRELFQPAVALCEQPYSFVWLIWQTLAENTIFFEPIRKFLKPAASAEGMWRYYLALSISKVFTRYRDEGVPHLQWWNKKRLAFDPLHRQLEEVKVEELEGQLLQEAWQLHLWLKTVKDEQKIECMATAPPLLLIGSSNLFKPSEFKLIEKYAQKKDVDYFLCESMLAFREINPFVLAMQTLASEKPFCKRSNNVYETTKEETLLVQLQSRLQAHDSIKLNKVDDTLRFFSCAGKIRQCEVLKDQLLYFLEEHPQCSFEDIAIVAPQIELFTAALEHVFSRANPFKIPHYFTSRQLSSDSFFFDTFFLLLGLKEAHFRYEHVQQLFVNRCFKSRFPLEKRQHWSEYCQELSICYGYDSQDLAVQKLDVDNSWRRGWQRFFNKTFIFDNQDSSPNLSTLADYQALIETLEGLYKFLDVADEKQPCSFWLAWVDELLDAYLWANEEADLLEEKRLRRALEKLRKSCATLTEEPCFNRQMLENLLKDLLEKDKLCERRPWAAGICCASIAELHTLPFKVIFVLGVDEGQLPRLEEKLDFDFFESDRLDLNSEAHLFRHLILAAKQKIAFFFNGCNAYSGQELSPALFIEQLWQFLEVEHEQGADLLHHLLEEHPLQSFSERYFQNGSKLFSYSQQAENCYLTLQKPERIACVDLKLAAICNLKKIDWKVLSRFVSSGSKFFWQRLFPHFYKEDTPSRYLGRLSLNYQQRQKFFQQCSGRWWQMLEQESLKDLEKELLELGVKHPHLLSKKSCENFLQNYENLLQEITQYAPPKGKHGNLQFFLTEEWGKSYYRDPFIRPGVMAGTDSRCQVYGRLGEVIVQEKTLSKIFHYSENMKNYPAESLIAALLTFASCPDIDYFQAYLLTGKGISQCLYSRSQHRHSITLQEPLQLLSQIVDIYFKLLEMPLAMEGEIYKLYPKISLYLCEHVKQERFPELSPELKQLPLNNG